MRQDDIYTTRRPLQHHCITVTQTSSNEQKFKFVAINAEVKLSTQKDQWNPLRLDWNPGNILVLAVQHFAILRA